MKIRTLAALAATMTGAHGAIPLVWDMNSNWSGDGTVTTPTTDGVFVDNWTGSGTASDIILTREGTLMDVFISLTPLDPDLPHSADFTITGVQTGATAGSYFISNLVNVSAFTTTASYQDPLGVAGLSQPWGPSLSQTGSPTESVTYSVFNGGLMEITNTGAQLGVSADTPFYAREVDSNIGVLVTQNLAGTIPAGATSYGLTNQTMTGSGLFAGLGPVDANRDGQLRGQEIFSGNIGDFGNDLEQMYITSTTWTVSDADGEAFDSDSAFRFTLEGRQWPDSIDQARALIPEPSTVLLGLLSLSLILRRKR